MYAIVRHYTSLYVVIIRFRPIPALHRNYPRPSFLYSLICLARVSGSVLLIVGLLDPICLLNENCGQIFVGLEYTVENKQISKIFVILGFKIGRKLC